MKPINFKWDKNSCYEISKKHNHRIDFKNDNPSAYSSARINGWLDDICSHMKPKGNRNKRLIYVYEFEDNSIYVGLTGNPEYRKWSHLNRKDSSVYKHMKKTGLYPKYIELTDYINFEESIIMEEYWKNEFHNKGFKILNISKTGALGGTNKKWTKEECKKVFLKCSSINEIKNNYISAYNSACKYNWLEELTIHIDYTPNGYWNDINNCKIESLKYNSRTEFKIKSPGCYYASIKNNWLNDICSHMKQLRNPKNYWTKEKCENAYLKVNKNKSKLKKKYSRAYHLMLKNNWFN